MAKTDGTKPTLEAVCAMQTAVMGWVAGRLSANDMTQLQQVFAIEMVKVEDVLEEQAESMGWNGTSTASPNIQAADSRRGFNIPGAADMNRSEIQELRQAEQDCRPILGDNMAAYDSGGAIYGAALRALGHDLKTVRTSDMGILFRQMKVSGLLQKKGAAMASDGASGRAASASFDKLFPDAVKLVKI